MRWLAHSSWRNSASVSCDWEEDGSCSGESTLLVSVVVVVVVVLTAATVSATEEAEAAAATIKGTVELVLLSLFRLVLVLCITHSI